MCRMKINKKENNDKINIFVLGNPLLKEDSISLKIIQKLEDKFPKVNFSEFDPTEDLNSEYLLFMDVVEGIDKVELIKDLSKLETRKIYSTHDFDLAFLLKILKKAKLIKEAIIIGIPKNAEEGESLKQVEKIIGRLLLKYKKRLENYKT